MDDPATLVTISKLQTRSPMAHEDSLRSIPCPLRAIGGFDVP